MSLPVQQYVIRFKVAVDIAQFVYGCYGHNHLCHVLEERNQGGDGAGWSHSLLERLSAVKGGKSVAPTRAIIGGQSHLPTLPKDAQNTFIPYLTGNFHVLQVSLYFINRNSLPSSGKFLCFRRATYRLFQTISITSTADLASFRPFSIPDYIHCLRF